VKLLKDGEDQKRKTYMALCIAPSRPFVSTKDLKKLSGMKNLELQQKTPIRVLHRRPNSIRSRTVYEMNAEPISKDQLNHFEDLDTDLDSNETQQVFRLRLTTQAGTYVKEFIHGDFGRTSPNLREILGIPDLDIIALDVLVIQLHFFLQLIDDVF
jgi:tRNA pseudouridine synthase 10